MTAKNDITGDLIKSKPSDTYADNYDAIFRKDKQNTTEQNEEQENLASNTSQSIK